MAAQYQSKHGIVSRPTYDLYMSFADMRNFTRMLPADKQEMVSADFDNITANVQNFSIGLKVTDRRPYALIEMQDNGAPFKFAIWLHFDETGTPGKTEFYIDAEADLNMMMKMMLGSKIKEALDKIVDGLVDVSEGRMPEGMPTDFKV